MDLLKYKRKLNIILFSFLIITLFVTFQKLLSFDTITNYDDKFLLGGVEKIQNVKDYINYFNSGKILDLQPIRDLSYFADFKIKSIFSSYPFHLTNLMLWIFICYSFKSLLEVFNDHSNRDQWLIWSFVFLYALSPVSSSSVGWIAARKHLLSTLFILNATCLFLKNRHNKIDIKSALGIFIFYIFSILSQPINVLWPMFAILLSFFDKRLKERKILLLILCLLSIVFLSLNYYYYSHLFISISGGDGKFDSNSNLGLTLLALGRYFYLSLFPFNALPVSHYEGSIENVIGLFLLFSFIYLIIKKMKKELLIFGFLAYFFIPLIPVTYKITKIFCSDTYLLNSSLGVYVSIFLIIKKFNFQKTHFLIIPYVIFLAIYNYNYVVVFEDTENIWNYSYNKEKTPMSIVNLASTLIINKRFNEAAPYVQELEVMDPNHRFLAKFKSEIVYLNPALDISDKIKKLEDMNPKVPIIYLELALLYSNNHDLKLFTKNIFTLLSNPVSYIENSYLINEKFLALVKVSCEENHIESDCQTKYKEFSKKVHFSDWNKKEYESYYYLYKNNPRSLVYE